MVEIFRLVAEMGWCGHALWLRKEAARRGYAWRQQQRARQLSSLRAACVPLVEMLARRCGTRFLEQASWWRRFGSWQREGRGTSTSGTGSGKGAGARVAVRSVLEDHETAILELERQVEGLANDVDLFGRLQSDLQDIVFKNRDQSHTIA